MNIYSCPCCTDPDAKLTISGPAMPAFRKPECSRLETRRSFVGRAGKALGWGGLAALMGDSLFAGIARAADDPVGLAPPPGGVPHSTFALELYARRSLNYYGRMVDADGLPYFDVFWTDPAEAAHDKFDFGDVMARQFQAIIMAGHMTGESRPIEVIWRKKLLSELDPDTGLLMRPQTSFSTPVADTGDQALTMYALSTAFLDSPDESLKRALEKMVDSMAARESVELHRHGYEIGFMIKSLMACGRACSYPPAIRLAGIQADKVMNGRVFTPDNAFGESRHMHGNLRMLVGLADYALHERDPVLLSRVDAVYRWVRSNAATEFGFMPEVYGRKGDVVATETCAIMDYVGLAVTLANHGHPEYWTDVERVVRNHLVESQLGDLSWLKTDSTRPDSAEFSWRGLSDRLVGAYAGWSSPTHVLAACETMDWGGSRVPAHLRGKTRLLQDCCGGSGTHAFFIAWKNAARFEGGTLSVHLHIDKLLPQAEIRGYQPFQGLLAIQLKQPCSVRVRIPEFVQAGQIRVECNGLESPAKAFGNYLELGQHSSGDAILVHYPLELRTQEVSIGNPGFRQYHYRVTWKGDTVVRMEPLNDDFDTGYSDFEKKQVRVFYGTKGPGALYQREDLIADAKPVNSALQPDDGSLDLWANLS